MCPLQTHYCVTVTYALSHTFPRCRPSAPHRGIKICAGREDSGANCPAPWSATDEGCSEYTTVARTGEQELPSPRMANMPAGRASTVDVFAVGAVNEAAVVEKGLQGAQGRSARQQGARRARRAGRSPLRSRPPPVQKVPIFAVPRACQPSVRISPARKRPPRRRMRKITANGAIARKQAKWTRRKYEYEGRTLYKAAA